MSPMNKKLNLLLLEDSEADIQLIQHQFHKQGLEVRWSFAENEMEFREAVKDSPDAIISDVRIPGFGAFAALEILSRWLDSTEGIASGPAEKIPPPLIVISGAVGEEMAVEAIKAGAKDFVVKSNLKRLSSVVLRSIREAHLERIEAEQRSRAEDAIRDRERLLEIVSHDLKNPLGAMTLNLQLLEETLKGAALRPPLIGAERSLQLVDRMKKSVIRVDRLIRDVLDQAKIEAGKFVISPHHTNLESLVSELKELFEPLAALRRVTLKFDLRLSSMEQVLDQERIHQVLSNLISNAIKFTAVDSEVIVTFSEYDETLRFMVKDQGPGIPDEEQGLVFTKFWQAPDRQKFGTGLGLSIAREIVRGHGGKIGIDSVPGQGSVFWFEIPRQQIDAQKSDGTALEGEEHLTILLLEDDEDLREVMEETLNTGSDEVISTSTGADALRRLRMGLRPQVFIVDHDLPGMDGTRFIREAYEQGLIPSYSRVVLTSAHPDLKDRAAALGLTLILQKPFSLRRLSTQVELWRKPRPQALKIQALPDHPAEDRGPQDKGL